MIKTIEDLTQEEKKDFGELLSSICPKLDINNLHGCIDETCKFYDYGRCDKLEYLHDIFLLSERA